MEADNSTQTTEDPAAPEHAAVDVAQLITSMRDKLGAFDQERPCQPTIYRVMRSVRKEDSAAYDPLIISIGPFHRDKPELQAMEELKWRFLHDLLHRCPETNLHIPTTTICEQVEDLREQYSEKFQDITDADFVKMMVLDGCFILELMIKLFVHGTQLALPGGKWVLSNVVNDLFLLENQIPFSVLQILFKALTPSPLRLTLPELSFLGFVAPGAPPTLLPDMSNRQFHHLLHFRHYCIVSQCKKEEPPFCSLWQGACYGLRLVRKMVSYALFQVCFQLFRLVFSCLVCSSPGCCNNSKRSPLPWIIPSVTKLKEAGIRFRRKEFVSMEFYSFLKVRFSRDEGIFEIPFLYLHGGSNSELRNLIAFEQCCGDLPENEHYYTSYCLLMAYLIDTEDDVGILEENGIISNFMGSASGVATLFDKVCKGSTIDHPNSCFARVLEDVSRYCESDLHRWRARLTHDYFSNPWTIISVVAAAVLLGLTVVQTYYTVYGYYNSR